MKQLSIVSTDEKKYLELLTNLIAQAMFLLVEPEIKIKCREKDANLVRVSSFQFKNFGFLKLNIFLIIACN